MARGRKAAATTNGSRPESKIEAARQLLARNPNVTASELSQAMKAEFGMDISPDVASTYRYTILKKQGKKPRRRQRKRRAPAAAVVPTAVAQNDGGGSEQGGLNDLLSAAGKLGWKRVKEIVDRVIGAPK
jgi:hypothetical protein